MANVPVTLQCSFCGKSQHEVKKLIAGPTVYICDECIGLCNDIITEEVGGEAWVETLPLEAKVFIGSLLDRGAKAAERLRQAGDEKDSVIPVEVRSAMAQLTSVWATVRASVERVDKMDSAPERLQPVLGLLIRVGDVLRTLRERAEELGLARWEKTIEESMQDLSTAGDLLRAQESKAAVKAPGPAA
jgi:hypothetical protein